MPGILGFSLYRLYRAMWTGLDWLYPPHCGGCGKQISRWCQECQRETKLITGQVCHKCGCVCDSGLCSRCGNVNIDYEGLRSWAIYSGPLRKAVHQLKYNGDMSLGEILARPMIELLQSLNWLIDIVVPVPMGNTRRSERGYNQAAMLAFPISLFLRRPYYPHALLKSRENLSQVGLNPSQRRANVRDVFVGREKFVKGKSVLIVDDVVTTGATMEACANAVQRAQARSVYGITLARSGLMVENISRD